MCKQSEIRWMRREAKRVKKYDFQFSISCLYWLTHVAADKLAGNYIWSAVDWPLGVRLSDVKLPICMILGNICAGKSIFNFPIVDKISVSMYI